MPGLDFKYGCFMFFDEEKMMSLLVFNLSFSTSFNVIISSVLCHCFEAISLVGILPKQGVILAW